MTTAHDLLTEPLLSWRDAKSRRGIATLPGLLAKLGTAELADFPRVRAHQFHPWGMFLTQLAAIALRRVGETDPRLPENDWCERLLALTNGEHEPWCLVVGDLAKAAFFQPPVPEGQTSSWSVHEHPDEIDVLVTSKGHDVKSGIISTKDVESWVYALVTLQTMQGYPGRGYNGIARMNGGYGNRARVGLASSPSLAARFVRDLRVLNDAWPSLMHRGYRDEGVALVWTAPWTGDNSLGFSELSPHFIEVCCRVRCASTADGLTCSYTTTTKRRCTPEVTNGDVGDPWVPIERDRGALTIGKRGFHYALLASLLFAADYAPAPAQELQSNDDDPMTMLLWAMARGKGKTEGLHERAIILSGPARRLLGQPDGRAVLGKRASVAVQQADTVHRQVLFPALRQLALGSQVVDDGFDARVDEIFFEHLFTSIEDDDDAVHVHWACTLKEVAWRELQSAIDRCSLPDARHYRAISDAERLFRRCLKRHFPDVFRDAERSVKGARS